MANIPPPPQYRPNPQAGQNMLDLIMNQGQVQAQNAERQGQIWGSALQGIGQTLAGGFQQYGEQQKVKKRTAALDAVFNGPEPPTLGSLVKILGPKDGVDAFKGLRATMPDAAKQYKDRMEQARDVARGVKALPPERQAAAYQFARTQLINGGIFKPEEAPEEFNTDFIAQLAGYGQEPPKPPGTREVTVTNLDGSKTTKIVEDVAGKEFTSAAEPKFQKVTVPGPNGPIEKLVSEAELKLGVPSYQAPNSSQVPSLQHVTTAEGIRSFNPRTGEMGPVVAQPPAPARASRPPTGAERTNLGFYNRAAKASDDITAKASENDLSLEEKVAKAGALDDFRLQYGSNLIQSPEQQQYRQAQRAFTEARLRKESGAAIPPAEYENDSKTYFAQPGDSKEVMKQKQEARASVLDSLRFSSGKAFEEYYGEPMPTPRNQAPGAPPPPPPGGAPGPARPIKDPVRVNTPAEAAALTPGTLYQTPDGKTMKR